MVDAAVVVSVAAVCREEDKLVKHHCNTPGTFVWSIHQHTAANPHNGPDHGRPRESTRLNTHLDLHQGSWLHCMTRRSPAPPLPCPSLPCPSMLLFNLPSTYVSMWPFLSLLFPVCFFLFLTFMDFFSSPPFFFFFLTSTVLLEFDPPYCPIMLFFCYIFVSSCSWL